MQNSNPRRLFLKQAMSASVVTVAAAAGLLTPRMVLAQWNADAFNATTAADAAGKSLGGAGEKSDKVKIKTPGTAENGAVVPIEISTTLPSPTQFAIVAEKNSKPLCITYDVEDGASVSMVGIRIKMGKTGNVTGIVKSGGKLYMAQEQVKVTAGGCA